MSESKKVKGSDLVAPGYLTDAKKEAEEFLDVVKDMIGSVKELNKATSGKLSNSKGSKSADLKEQNKLMAESAKQRKLIVEAEKMELKATLDLDKAKKALSDFEKKKLMDDEKGIKLIQQQNSAYSEASKRLNQLRKDYKDLAISGKGAEVETQKLLKTIQDLDKELKEVDASVGQFNRNVGDYKNAMSDALVETGAFSQGLSKLDSQTAATVAGFGGIVEQLKKVRQAQAAATTGSQKLGNALKGAGIFALIAAIGAITAFFSSSREGALEFELALNKLKATVSIVIGSLAQLGSGLIDKFKAFSLYIDGISDKVSFSAKQRAEGERKIAESELLSAAATKKLTTAFDGNIDAISAQIDLYDEITRKIFKYEDQIRILSVTLNNAKRDEEDFNEIQQDNTISLNEQKAALEGAVQARQEAAKIAVQIANKELEVSELELERSLSQNKVSKEEIDLLKRKGFQTISSSALALKAGEVELKAFYERYEAQLAAADVLDDLDRQEAERQRQIIQTETINNIELIRSKKLGADAQVQILTKQVSDEKIQLEDREKIQQQLTDRQLAAQAEEIKLLENFGLTQSEVLDLINEKDAVLLSNKLKDLRATRLSDEATTELAKVINESQTAQLAREAQLAKFEDERIQREQKILRLNQEIAIINEQSVLEDVTNMEAQRQKILDQSNATILQNNNVFIRASLQARQKAANEEEAILQEEFKIRNDLLAKQYEIDQQNIKNSVNDDQLKNKELEKLAATNAANKAKLTSEQDNKLKALADKEIEQQRLIENRKTFIVVENLQKATQALSDEIDRRSTIQNNSAQVELNNTQTAITKQQDLAARGLANQLAFEEANLAKRQLAQQDALQRQAKEKERIATGEALLTAFNSELNQPNSNPQTAAMRAVKDVLFFKGIAKAFQYAVDGNNMIEGPGTTTSDSIPFMLSQKEAVIKASANVKHNDAVVALNAGNFDQLYMPRFDISKSLPDSGDMALNIARSISLQHNEQILSELQKLNAKPVPYFGADQLGNLIEKTYKDGFITATKIKPRKPRI